MTEPNDASRISPEETLAKNVTMLKRALQRFKANVRVSDLDYLGTDCRAIGHELTELGEVLEAVAVIHEKAD